MNKEFLDFISSSETVPSDLKKEAHRDILLSFRSRSILIRFFFFQCLGALVSLTVCPQFGIGFADGHGISHVFRSMGDVTCAVFCGVFFFTAASMTSFIGMSGEELWWTWRRYKFSTIFLPPILWGLLMMGNFTLDFAGEGVNFHLAWLASAMTIQALWLQLRSGIHLSHFRQRQ